jgi:hypothetical protein
MDKLAATSIIGSNIITMARHHWPVDQATSKLANEVRRERLLVAGGLASCSIIHLHTTTFASCLFQCGVDVSSPPPASSISYIQNAARAAFDFLRDSVSYNSPLSMIRRLFEDRNSSSNGPNYPTPSEHSSQSPSPFYTPLLPGTSGQNSMGRPRDTYEDYTSPPHHSSFFACTYFIAAQGTLMTLNNIHSSQMTDLTIAALATDFQLAESVIRKQCSRWANSHAVADELCRMTETLQSKIENRMTRRIVACSE